MLIRRTRRRYVIRLRVETDQFLLSCVELGTFVTWLDGIYAAIQVSPPIDERSFPRDFTITRIERIRWLQGQRPQLEDSSGHGHSGHGHTPDYGSRAGHPIVRLLSTTSYPNESIDPDT